MKVNYYNILVHMVRYGEKSKHPNKAFEKRHSKEANKEKSVWGKGRRWRLRCQNSRMAEGRKKQVVLVNTYCSKYPINTNHYFFFSSYHIFIISYIYFSSFLTFISMSQVE